MPKGGGGSCVFYQLHFQIYVNSLRFFADLRPFKLPALVGLLCFSECVIRNKLVIIIIVITVMKNGFINV